MTENIADSTSVHRKPRKNYRPGLINTSVMSLPVKLQDTPPATQITFHEFESVLKSQNEKLLEQRRQDRLTDMGKRRQERLEDMKKLNLLLGLPT